MKGSSYGRHLIPVIVFLMISGCLDENISEASEYITSEEGVQKSYSVVAPVDTGINPYHMHFQVNQSLPQSFLDDFGVTLVWTCHKKALGRNVLKRTGNRAGIG